MITKGRSPRTDDEKRGVVCSGDSSAVCTLVGTAYGGTRGRNPKTRRRKYFQGGNA
jgi:hypothetical protein